MSNVIIPVAVTGKDSGKQLANFSIGESIIIDIDTGSEGVDMFDIHLRVKGAGVTIRRSQLSTEPTGSVDFHMFGSNGDDAATAQTLIELANLLIPTLIQVTPGWGTAISHTAYSTTQSAIITNAEAIVAQLKVSPTWPTIVRALAASLPPVY